MIKRHSKVMLISRRVKANVSETGAIIWERRDFECRVDLEIDMVGLFELIGHKAIGNKSKRSRLLGGIIKGQVNVGDEIKNHESAA